MKKQCMILLALAVAGSILMGSGVLEISAREVRIADSKGDWGYPNPFRHYPRGPGYVRMSWVFDTLIWKDRTGYIPALATEWRYDAERMAFVFHLNPKARWHDGQPVTADDVVFTISLFQKSPYFWISIADVDRGVAVSPHTVEIFLSRPYAPFLSEIGGTMPIMPRHIWESVEDPATFMEPAAFVGSGPFRFGDFDKTQGTYRYDVFEDYYQGKPLVDRVIYVRVTQPLAALTTGQADWCMIPPDMVAPLTKKGLTIIRDERGWNKKLMINHQKFPFSDVRFRKALAHAMDVQEIIDKSHRGFGTKASCGLLSIDHEWYTPDTPRYDHDPEKARALISELGYEIGPTGFFEKAGQPLILELLSSNISVGGQAAADRDGEVIQKQLARAGIRVDLVNLEQGSTDTRIRNWEFDLAVSGHGGVSGDPRFLSEQISSKYGEGSVNSARYDANPRLNDLLDMQLREMDPDRRRELVHEIQILVAQELPAIPLYYPDSFSAFHPARGIDWYYTPGGMGKGVPIAQNKMALIP